MTDLEPYRKAICVLYADNWAVAALALRYRVERKHMQECLERWGVIEPRPRILPTSPRELKCAEPFAPDDEPEPRRQATHVNNAERNQKIMDLKAEGLSSGKIVARLKASYPGLSRSAVIGVIHRHMPAEVRARDVEEGHHAIRMRAKRTAPPPRPPKPTPPPRIFNKAPIYRPIEPPLETLLGEPVLAVPPPEHDAGVTLLQRTGCAWPYGDARQGAITFCNRPRCSIRQGGLDSLLTPYCAEHWARRRASSYTKIVA
jgi:hypothetical protein